MRAAFLAAPSTGGVGTFWCTLRKALAAHNIELQWIASGPSAERQREMWARQLEAEAGALRVLATNTQDATERTRALLGHIIAEHFSVVLFNTLCGPVETNLLFYLPRDIRRVGIVHTITLSTYRAAKAVSRFADAMICVSPRILNDLVAHWGLAPGRTFLVPNAVDESCFMDLAPRAPAERLRLLFIGRVRDADKGVAWLPQIVEGCVSSGCRVQLTVAGDGPDLATLRTSVAANGLSEAFVFLGRVPRSEIPRLANEHDVLIVPSRYEGCSQALIEGMAAACVPVASRIRGVTDYIVQDGVTGFLFSIGRISRAVRCVAHLAKDPAMLLDMKIAARRATLGRFSLDRQGELYAGIIGSILSRSVATPEPRALEDYELHPSLKPGWWYPLPECVKVRLRHLREVLYGGV